MCWDVNFYKKQSPESKQLIFKSDMLQNNPYRSDRGLNFIFYSCIGTFEYRRPLLCVHKAFCFTCQISSRAVWVHKHVDEQAWPPEDCSSWSASCSGWGMRVSHVAEQPSPRQQHGSGKQSSMTVSVPAPQSCCLFEKWRRAVPVTWDVL